MNIVRMPNSSCGRDAEGKRIQIAGLSFPSKVAAENRVAGNTCLTFRKVTNCFRSQWGADLYADIRSVIEAARRHAVGAFETIRLTLDNILLPSRQPIPIPIG
jgi:hypothetical protein